MSDDFDPHNTDWHNVDIFRFTLWMSVFSIGENAVFYPFYVLKTREQADRSVNYKALASARYHLTQILKTQGVRRGLYKGFFASSIVSLPAYGLYSGVYTWSKEKLGYQHSGVAANEENQSRYERAYINYAAPFLAGLIADIASVVLYVPGDVIVQRMQIANSPYHSFTDACVKVWRSEGIQGFYRGFGATFVTGAVASACWWMVYENSKRKLYSVKNHQSESHDKSQSVTDVNRWPQFIAGFLAGTVTSVVINPLDVVKTRLQTQHTQTSINQSTKQSNVTQHEHYRNLSSGLIQVYREEGMRGYFRGVMPKLVSRGPISALSSIMYEMVLFLSRKDRTVDRTKETQALV